jgi:hypothetical protein
MNFKSILSIKLALFFFISNAGAQLVTINPTFPSPEDAATITFNATMGSGGLAGYTGDVYAHTGVITNQSNSSSDWKHVKTSWGQNTPDTKLTRIGPDLYELSITPDIRSYYGVPMNETIEKIAMVFRSDLPVSGSYLEGKTSAGGDIFLDVTAGDGLSIQLVQPTQRNFITALGSQVEILANVSLPSKIKIFENNILIDSVLNATSYSNIVMATDGSHFYEITAEAQGETAETSFSYIISKTPNYANRPNGGQLGAIPLGNNMVRLVLEAPLKQNALLHSNLSDWRFNSDYWMNQTFDRRFFWIDVDVSALQGEPLLYQYVVNGEITVADPHAELILDRRDDAFIDDNLFPDLIEFPELAMGLHVTVYDSFSYDWQIDDFVKPDQRKMVIYELLIRDFLHNHSYQSLIDTISYLKNLGINAIELMPVNEFEGNISWGYNPSFQGAVDKYYGTPQKLKAFVDVCHANGIAVIMDVVFNHVFSQSPLAQLYWDAANFRPAPNNPWLNVEAKHPFNVGYDVNHEYIGTKDWMERVLENWVTAYRIDGFRFDLSKGFTQTNNPTNVGAWGNYDASRISLLKQMADKLWAVDPDSYVILEHFADNSEEKELAEYGMMTWGNMNHNYTEAAMGYAAGANSDLSGGLASSRGWSVKHLVSYMESHDEERMVYKNLTFGNSDGSYSTKNPTTALERVGLASTFFYLLPGPKMIWQFGELGYPYSINRCEDGTVDNNCRLSPKPIRWDYFVDPPRKEIFDIVRDLIYLKQSFSVFNAGEFNHDLSGTIKSYNFKNGDISAQAIGNFGVTSGTASVEFPKTGTWYEYFSGDELVITTRSQSINLAAGEYRLYLDEQVDRLSVIDPVSSTSTLHSSQKVDVLIYPNPISGGQFTIEFTDQIDVKSIQLHSLNGVEMGIRQYRHDGEGKWQIFMNESLAPGIYTLHVTADQGQFGKMIVVGL